TRNAIRRHDRSWAEDTTFARDSPYRTIGNSSTRPNARNIVVTKSKYGPAAGAAMRRPPVNDSRNPIANGSTTEGIATPMGKKGIARGIHGRIAFFSLSVRPGEMNAHS